MRKEVELRGRRGSEGRRREAEILAVEPAPDRTQRFDRVRERAPALGRIAERIERPLRCADAEADPLRSADLGERRRFHRQHGRMARDRVGDADANTHPLRAGEHGCARAEHGAVLATLGDRHLVEAQLVRPLCESNRRREMIFVGEGQSETGKGHEPNLPRREYTMWIEPVPYREAEGELKAAYDRQARALGEPTELTLAGSLDPPLVAARWTSMRRRNDARRRSHRTSAT